MAAACANCLEPITTHRITTRYWPNVTADMRLLYGTRIFTILSIINPEERNITLQILAKEGIGG